MSDKTGIILKDFNMATAYGLKFYKTVQGVNVADGNRYPVTLKIYEKDYNGFSSEIEALGADSIRISFGNQGDRRYEPIKKTSISFSIIDTEQFDYTQFYTSDATKYKVEVEALGFKHVGFIVQDSFSRALSYKAAINLTAIDNLSILDGLKFEELGLPKHCLIEDIINACAQKCYPGASVSYKCSDLYYYGSLRQNGEPINGLKFQQCTIRTSIFKEKDLKNVLESLLLSGMLYITQSGAGYIIKEYTSDHIGSALLRRKISARFDGESELSMTPAVRNFRLVNNLEEYSSLDGIIPKGKAYFWGADRQELRSWDNTLGQVMSGPGFSGQTSLLTYKGLPLATKDDEDVICTYVFPVALYNAREPYSTYKLGLMPDKFNIEFDLSAEYTFSVGRTSYQKEEVIKLKNMSLRLALFYRQAGVTYYYNSETKIWQSAFNLCVLTIDNANGNITVALNAQMEKTANKEVYMSIYPIMSSDAEPNTKGSAGGYTRIKGIELKSPGIEDNTYDANVLNVKVGDNNIDREEDVLFSSSPSSNRSSILTYNNILISTLNNETDIIQHVRSNVGMPDMLMLEYQARACLFMAEAPAKTINGSVFMNTTDMVADYVTTNDGYLSSGEDQIVLADTQSSKAITRVDTLFDFILASKFGDYRMNYAEINLLRFAIDGEFCEVKEFYISDYIANQPIINTFIQRNYLKHS